MKLGVFGGQGSGKTFFSVLIARIIQRSYPEVDIYTNVSGRYDDASWHMIEDLADYPFDTTVDEDPDYVPPPKVFILDEAMFSVSSRASGSNINELWSRAFAFFRKQNNCLAIFATHRPSMLDVRFRDQLDAVVMCRKNPKHFDYLYYDIVTQLSVPFIVLRDKKLFEFANYNTRQMPMPLEVVRLAEHPLFQLKKIERKKVKA